MLEMRGRFPNIPTQGSLPSSLDKKHALLLDERGRAIQFLDWTMQGNHLNTLTQYAHDLFAKQRAFINPLSVLFNLYFAIEGKKFYNDQRCVCFQTRKAEKKARVFLEEKASVCLKEALQKPHFLNTCHDLYLCLTRTDSPYMQQDPEKVLMELAVAFHNNTPLTKDEWLARLNPENGRALHLREVLNVIDTLCFEQRFFMEEEHKDARIVSRSMVRQNIATSLRNLLAADEAFVEEILAQKDDKNQLGAKGIEDLEFIILQLKRGESFDQSTSLSVFENSAMSRLFADVFSGGLVLTFEQIKNRLFLLIAKEPLAKKSWAAVLENFKTEEITLFLQCVERSKPEDPIRSNLLKSIENLILFIGEEKDRSVAEKINLPLKTILSFLRSPKKSSIAELQSAYTWEDDTKNLLDLNRFHFFICHIEAIASIESKADLSKRVVVGLKKNTPLNFDLLKGCTPLETRLQILVQFLETVLRRENVQNFSVTERESIENKLQSLLDFEKSNYETQPETRLCEHLAGRVATVAFGNEMLTQFDVILKAIDRLEHNPDALVGGMGKLGKLVPNFLKAHPVAAPTFGTGVYRAFKEESPEKSLASQTSPPLKPSKDPKGKKRSLSDHRLLGSVASDDEN